ncbi:MAG: 2-C-methyl-D-erythritol 2,4-cyclodiphosphate synthase [Desulfobacterales bacterium]
MRIGIGHDIHKLVPNRKLILGGVDIPFVKGLTGHSDADVLVHAVCDALLGAASLGDIGMHFPDTDDRFLNIDSIELLGRTGRLLEKHGFAVINLDATVFAEFPKLGGYRSRMVKNIAEALHIRKDRVNVKFTTTEGLGFVGNGSGMMAHCIALITSRSNDRTSFKDPAPGI